MKTYFIMRLKQTNIRHLSGIRVCSPRWRYVIPADAAHWSTRDELFISTFHPKTVMPDGCRRTGFYRETVAIISHLLCGDTAKACNTRIREPRAKSHRQEFTAVVRVAKQCLTSVNRAIPTTRIYGQITDSLATFTLQKQNMCLNWQASIGYYTRKPYVSVGYVVHVRVDR